MCGIAGIANISNAGFQISAEHLNQMQRILIHRGPNGYGIWLSVDNQIGFAHRRLSIIDLSEAGAQPMMDSEQTVVVSYNGEIYNFKELQQELESLGYSYFSTSDTETIIYAYKEWGISCLEKFEGMFAISLYDLKKNELYLIRDRIGIKPLYYTIQNGILSFASEIKALWCLPWNTKELNPEGLYHYLTYLVTPAPQTMYNNVQKLPAGWYIKVDAKRTISFHEWYDPIMSAKVYDKKDLADEQFCITTIRHLLRTSIQKQMRSDVPFGVFLSGGIDSSLNVALMSEFTDKVKTFNVSFSDGPEYSEVEWARRVARRFNTEHHEIVIAEKDAFEFFQKMVYHQDEPLADCVCVPLYYVAKLLKDSGVTVVQVGEGSDELFCGYSTYAQYLDVHRKYWQPTQKLIPAFMQKGMYGLARKLIPHKQNRLDMIKNWSEGKSFFWSGATVFSEVWKHEIWQDEQFDSYEMVQEYLQKLATYDPHADFLKSMIYLEFKHRLPELLLMRVDKMAMATSVEGRVPFLDHHLVEFAFQIPASLKYKQGITKYILKKACEGILPHDVIYRKKVGFAAPTSRWFKQGAYFKPYFLDLLEEKRNALQPYLQVDVLKKLYTTNQEQPVDYATQLWLIQNLIAMDLFV